MHGNAVPDPGNEAPPATASTAVERDLYPVPEAGVRLGISERQVWYLLKSGELGSVLLGGRRLIPAAALQAYVERLTTGAVA